MGLARQNFQHGNLKTHATLRKTLQHSTALEAMGGASGAWSARSEHFEARLWPRDRGVQGQGRAGQGSLVARHINSNE
jgi:hypothetical protein